MKLDALSIHTTFECNKNPPCKNCYMASYRGKDNFTNDEWMKLPKIASKLGIKQLAMGGGEVTIDKKFLKQFGKECKKQGVILNITTNGLDIKDTTIFKDVTMVSLSFNDQLIVSEDDYNNYMDTLQSLSKVTKVSSNLLLNKELIENPIVLLKLINVLIYNGVDRIFLLHPKPSTINILPIKDFILHLLIKYPVYIDDLIKNVIENESYFNWKGKCHYANGFLSLSGKELKGCSFATKSLATLKKMEDLLDVIPTLASDGFNFCPALLGEEF